METVITAKLLLNVSNEQFSLLEAVSCAYRDACNYVSSLAFHEREYNAVNLQKMSYAVLRDSFGLKAQKRIKVSFSSKGFEKYINKDAVFGGAKLVLRKGRAFLYVSVKLNSPDFAFDERKVVGIDRGIINTAVTYDGKKTRFYKEESEVQGSAPVSAEEKHTIIQKKAESNRKEREPLRQ